MYPYKQLAHALGSSWRLKLRPATMTMEPLDQSFPFERKTLFMEVDKIFVLGYGDADQGENPTPTNSVFAPHEVSSGEPIYPALLCAKHAQMFCDGQLVYLKNLESPDGTWLNGYKLRGEALLRNGDIISLGRPIELNENTPSRLQNLPITFKATITGHKLDNYPPLENDDGNSSSDDESQLDEYPPADYEYRLANYRPSLDSTSLYNRASFESNSQPS